MDKEVCPVCGKLLKNTSRKGRRRKFCSARCRMEWWKNHPSKKGHDIRRIRVYKCTWCGKLFRGYESTERKSATTTATYPIGSETVLNAL